MEPLYPTVAVINASTVLDDAAVDVAVPALQAQVHEHFVPIWGQDAELVFVPKGELPPSGSWWLAILDDSDQAGALGYHDLAADLLPISKVFAGSDLAAGEEWTVTASHECLEMLADPTINRCAQVGPDRFFALEVCDAVEADAFGYEIDGVTVSDFVCPEWFGNGEGLSTVSQLDYCGVVTGPQVLLHGGYIGAWTPSTGWTQATDFDVAPPPAGSRRERRARGRHSWQISTAHARQEDT